MRIDIYCEIFQDLDAFFSLVQSEDIVTTPGKAHQMIALSVPNIEEFPAVNRLLSRWSVKVVLRYVIAKPLGVRILGVLVSEVYGFKIATHLYHTY